MPKIKPFSSKRLFLFPLLLFFALFSFEACFFHISGVDTGFHIRTGELVWRTGQIPSTNTFSSSMPDHPWLLHQWLPATLIYLVWVHFGVSGLIVFKAFLGTAIFLAIYAASVCEAQGRSRFLAAFWAATLAIMLTRIRIFVRPYLFSALLLALLYQADRQHYRKRSWHFLGIPLLMALWSNIHMGVIVGYQLLFILRGVKWLEWGVKKYRAQDAGQPPIRESIALLLSLAASAGAVALINPNGIAVLAAPVRFYLDPYWKTTITELAPPTGWTRLILISFISITGILCLLNRKRIHWGPLLSFVFFSWLALRTQRAVLFFAIVATPLLTSQLSLVFERIPHKWLGLHIPALLLCWALLIWSVILPDPTFTFGTGVNLKYHPVSIFAFMREKVPPQNIYNDMAYGGPMLWSLYPRFRPFIDGRGEAYSLSFWKNTYEPVSQGRGSLACFDSFDLSGALLWNPAGSSRPLARLLADSPQWHMVAYDDNTMLFLKNTPANRVVLGGYAITHFDPTASEMIIPESDLADAAREAATAFTVTPLSLYWKTALARTALLSQNYRAAYSLYRDLLSRGGNSYPHLRDLAYCQFMLGDVDGATRLYSQLIAHPHHDGYAYYMLAVIEEQAGRRAVAKAWIDRAVEAFPDNELYQKKKSSLTDSK